MKRDDPQRDPATGVQFFDTAIVSLELAGSDPVLGQFTLSARPSPPSTGQTRSVNPMPTYPATGFFDVFFDLVTEFEGRFTGGAAMRVLASPDDGNPIRDTPPHPGTLHLSRPGAAVLLFDENSEPAGEISDLRYELGGYNSCEAMPAGGESCAKTSWEAKVRIFDPFVPGGCTAELRLAGPYRHVRGNPVDPGDGRDLVQWLLAKVTATSADPGETACLGLVTLRLSQTEAPSGQVQSLAPAENFPAGAFLDVWAVLDTGALGRLAAGAPVRFAATLDDLPPSGGEAFVAEGQAVPLLDAFGNEVGAIAFEELRVEDPGRCPFEDEPHLTIGPDGQTLVASSKGAGAGLHYDLARGQLGPSSTLDRVESLGAADCLQDNGGNTFTDSHEPPPGDLLWYLWRDGYDTGQGSWNDPFVAVDRDRLIVACP